MSAFVPGLFVLGIGLAVLISFPLFFSGQHTRKEPGELYHDEDGITTQEIQTAFKQTSRSCIILLLLFNAVGFASNTTAAILMSADLKGFPNRLQLLLVALKISAAVGNIPFPSVESRMTNYFVGSLILSNHNYRNYSIAYRPTNTSLYCRSLQRVCLWWKSMV